MNKPKTDVDFVQKISAWPRPLVLAFCLIVVAASVVHFVVNSMNTDKPELDPHKVIKGWKYARAANYVTTTNNGSRRIGLSPAQVPLQAQQLADDYRTIIYPALKKELSITPILPGSMSAIPELEKYYRLHPQWSSLNSFRLDGTMIGHNLYSKNHPNEPHDPWTSYIIDEANGHPLKASHFIIVAGWDDGQVTFNSFSELYQRDVKTPLGEVPVSAPPGAAGIPPGTHQIKDL